MIPLINSYGRVFINNTQDYKYRFYNFMKVGAVDRNIGDNVSVVILDDDGKPTKVSAIRSGVETITSTLSGIVPIDKKSSLETLIKKNNFNMQVHYGSCTKPTDFGNFSSAVVFKDIGIQNHNLTELTALNSSQRTTMEETGTISIVEMYRVLSLSYDRVYGTSTIVSLIHVDTSECNNQADNNVWLGTVDTSTFRFIYTIDNGNSWDTNDANVEVHAGAATSTALAINGNEVYFSIQTSTHLKIYHTDLNNIITGNVITPAEIYNKPSDCIRAFSKTKNYLWAVGGAASPLILRINLHTKEVEEITSTVFASDITLWAVDAVSDDYAIIGGSIGHCGVYDNGDWSDISVFDSSLTITSLKCIDENNVVASGTTGAFVTHDRSNWNKVLITLSQCKMAFYDNVTGYLFNAKGLYRTTDSGNSWNLVKSYNYTTAIACAMASNDVNHIYFADTSNIIKGQD